MSVFVLFIIYISILIFSVILHEVAHGVAANLLGDQTAKMLGRLTLNPLPHVDLLGSIVIPLGMVLLSLFGGGSFIFGWAKPVPYNPNNFKRNKKWGEALVGIAGPATNFLLAITFGLSLRFILPLIDTMPQLLGVAIVFTIIVQLNLLLGIFNLVPIPPLDGSKLFYVLFKIPHQTKVFLERNGFMLLLLFIFFGFGLIAPLIDSAFSLLTGASLRAVL
ncbi:MAG: hypothetical protein A3F94_01060 [Candidatus Spechtbacteria bacterium RIFCSPLOWO2_12_FULL_38_22]|uniref:Peptidase M50 domain-containing protein n=1 Tax=Candidatus Spechtbacteria bacterium RIFCSPLOWO2_12_FULL_38_22 TaxID=1802165 RepID=A0A1G2HI40_9BACT|nr:MAG: hypothetical protein A2728_01595 [Candidatus Spechtbacteria bacterium RIFCSPHIGHO2_01_FULL_38_11]OGZ59282.1 MAG: hypothetical protein A3E58_02700 [Candidatus Spechtbacteria bacterium RIFCSPHIGHO2_12_FULL_38_30]OGZ60752.1 MAG: hypothetical protein A3A00_02485 [Candidatus Spechtbacteria bacterium RIFCSPLOWO2_01_FULL_38_20]OGZ62155.1 MAG: hypothetical protein A3F94_01060 [Candidatus Spechtbacteria bacterium RIFCSPLOWO2_12_FULL_38_22]